MVESCCIREGAPFLDVWVVSWLWRGTQGHPLHPHKRRQRFRKVLESQGLLRLLPRPPPRAICSPLFGLALGLLVLMGTRV